jgi:four helix bundle protein
MSKIEKFEDLICWQKARELVKGIYKLAEPDKFKKDYSLIDQIRRASVSIMLNISEGFALRTSKEFKRHLFLAHGSVAEVQSVLYIAKDLNYIDSENFRKYYDNCTEISKILSGLIKSIN